MSAFPMERVLAALRGAGLLVETRGELPREGADLADDSRAVVPGGVFIAVRGAERDGHDYLDDARARGAAAAIVEDPARTTLPCIVVREGRRAAAIAAAAAFDRRQRRLRLYAVTGTNGKTTTVGILRHLLDAPGAPAASIGTLGVLVGSEGAPTEGGGGLTTPGPVELQRVFRRLVERGVRTVAMEVSSHSLDQRRVEGVSFDAAVFTNLTRDHLDYHGTMEAYLAAKARLVENLSPDGVAVVNADDPAWAALPAAPRQVTFSAEGREASLRALEVRHAPRGSELLLEADGERRRARLPLIGSFNIANALGAAAAAWATGTSLDAIVERLATLPQVPGRLEMLSERPTVLRDYAHTPDALERALEAVRPFVRGRLIVVFGCGGDRDRGKRPVMGRIAQEGADVAVVTSDNPRTEDPEHILNEIVAGMSVDERVVRIEDRREAIAHALEIADRDADVVLLAGKGHETYQIRGTVKHPFDEKAIVRELLDHAARRADAGGAR
jgi:UDP-N-acetylmuramoyl-L-alanyl-D-glutamate--2,6-diaminopimelate ligase